MLEDLFTGKDWRILMAKGFVVFCLLSPLAYCQSRENKDEVEAQISRNALQLACINNHGSWSAEKGECTFISVK